ncbi:glycosyltransferase [Mongoliitalea daihaiensis]|uniref:glycosyltransferase n=1 Tax=Mongoliitalea daihaiensis TaxID=2782006 RepID=UPI001F34D46B|nr:glycosyltransferase [Mongoliitalea daihaiensis]UJP65530.1 glycosyltransferase [Mongoliitalea daihaiensis]
MKQSKLLGKVLLVAGIVSLVAFIYGFFTEVQVGHKFMYGLLTVSLFFKLLKVGFEWYHYAGLPKPKDQTLPPKKPSKNYTVDMLTTFCPGEPYDMLENTLKALVAVKYPHKTYLCDEGDDPYVKKMCENLGVIHVTRETHENAKAGNINNALKQCTGELCVILDPDHAPFPEFLDHVLHHFDDPKIGYVQVVQAYGNQTDSMVAHAAAEQTYAFYGPFMQAMSGYGTAQAIGANCTFRREALDSIGGHAPGLTEDMHTSMLLHAKGWESVYEPVILSRGLVPSSLSAFYLQQLKWSRGTFDLWFNLYPKLFTKFTWRQKIHYGLIPVYYLLGLITVIDILIPIFSLVTGEYPWILEPKIFFAYFTPFILMSLAYRAYSQSWMHEKKEKGLHFFGGVLKVGTWWVFSLGFFYTLINKKVPYLPTPKQHSTKGEFALGLPNLIIAGVSLLAIVYGLSKDWQPYSMFMAFFAGINAFIFFMAFIAGQTVFVTKLQKVWRGVKNSWIKSYIDYSYVKISRISFNILLIVSFLFGGIFLVTSFIGGSEDYLNPRLKTPLEKRLGGFYTGLYDPHFDFTKDITLISNLESASQVQWNILSSYLSWGDEPLPIDKWEQIIDHGAIPMITWEPWTNRFSQYEHIEDIQNNQKVFEYILNGYFDEYIDQTAEAIRDLYSPVFLRFAHEMENPMYPWSEAGGNTAEEFIDAWKYVHFRFENAGAQNVSWIWSPWSTEGFESYFPYGNDSLQTQYVDWIGLTALNYGLASENQQVKIFEEIYAPFKEQIQEKGLELPVMLAEFGSTSYDFDGKQWVKESLSVIGKKHREIKAVVHFFSDWDRNWITGWRPDANAEFIDWTFDLNDINLSYKPFDVCSYTNYLTQKGNNQHKPNMLHSEKGNHQLLVDGEPFFIHGVCYNPGHDWEEGFHPLSSKQLAIDFHQIKEMGANTVRRYEPGIFDRNILRAAKNQDLKVMYGFWFDPKIDYLKDHKSLRHYQKKVLKTVRKLKDDKSIIAWNIGNETWGLLKKHNAEPYLSMVRKSYFEFLNELAIEIKKIDPDRPVFSSEEHDNERLLAAIYQYRAFAPNIDVIGVNSYYEENISELSNIFESRFSDIPYVVTEFGPIGYWNKEYGDYRSDSLLLERTSVNKAAWYKNQWTDYIEKNRGLNLGGMAFSWKDRYEGSATWFGLTDHKGRLKPTYYALKEAWNADFLEGSINFPEIVIVAPWVDLQPGSTQWFSAQIVNEYEGKLEYEWEIYDKKWKRFKPVINSKVDNQFVELLTPSQASRIYVYATDTLGNVITASRPILMKPTYN